MSGMRPFVQEIPWSDPATMFARLADRPGIAFLDSAAVGDPRSNASYIAVDPVEEVRLAVGSMDQACLLYTSPSPRD